jgi:hypothetical protein
MTDATPSPPVTMTERRMKSLDELLSGLPPERRAEVERRARELIEIERRRWLDDELDKL